MSLITRCPACGTTFKVVPDQIRISEGWVRCGQCSEVFDALTDLRQSPDAAPGARAPAPLQAPAPETKVEAAAKVETDAAQAQTHEDAYADAHVAAEPESELAPESVVNDATPDGTAAAVPTEAAGADDPLADLSFVRQARRRAFWRRPLVRATLGLAGLLLLVLLALQVAVQERDRIAAWQPLSKPWLRALCEPLACRVAPLRQIESLVIDSSSFDRAPDGRYQLSLSMRNRSALALAMPAVELTLTDAQDQPLIRRVLAPAELGASPVLAGRAEWSGSLPVRLLDADLGAHVAGYRVLVFYP